MIKKSDLKTFALIWAGIFIVIGLAPFLKHGNIRIWAVIVSLIFITLAFSKPEILTKFYQIWLKIGHFIGGIISKIIMFILYFGVFTPVSLVLKFIGKDLLNKKLDRSKKSYWIDRERQPESMKNQF